MTVPAHRLYKIALQRGFTRGRRTNQVAAACLYLVCRQDSKPFLLIDFSDSLQVGGKAWQLPLRGGVGQAAAACSCRVWPRLRGAEPRPPHNCCVLTQHGIPL